jgi:XTP/dITP diphosphohydrolase
MTICFATNNKKKIEEVKAALKGKDISIQSLEEIGCKDELPETGNTLEENALQKAQYIYDHFGVDCFADDTGLEVDILEGAPGVYSGRYAGEPRSDERNVHLLLEQMQGRKNREARFKTVIALILRGKRYKFEGIAKGFISEKRSGEKGFGYDPVFIPEGNFRTFAELSTEEKNRISHRGKAVRELINFLKEPMP